MILYIIYILTVTVSYGRIYSPYEEGAFNLQVEYTKNITMGVEIKNTIEKVIHACMLQLYIKAGIKIFGKKQEESAQK